MGGLLNNPCGFWKSVIEFVSKHLFRLTLTHVYPGLAHLFSVWGYKVGAYTLLDLLIQPTR